MAAKPASEAEGSGVPSTSNSIATGAGIAAIGPTAVSNSAPSTQTSTPAVLTPPPNPTTSTSAPPSTSITPAKPTTNGNHVASIASTSTTDHYSHNPLYECLVCSRQVSSNRYAPHLAKCLGLGPNSSSKTSSSRKGKASDTNAAALAFSRGQKVASALENRKKAMGMSNGSSARNSPNRDSDDASNEASAKRKTLADSLGLNKNGKRSGSPVLGVGTGNWKRNKNKTATPPPSSLKDSDPNSSLSVGSGMARSLSANSQLPSTLQVNLSLTLLSTPTSTTIRRAQTRMTLNLVSLEAKRMSLHQNLVASTRQMVRVKFWEGVRMRTWKTTSTVQPLFWFWLDSQSRKTQKESWERGESSECRRIPA